MLQNNVNKSIDYKIGFEKMGFSTDSLGDKQLLANGNIMDHQHKTKEKEIIFDVRESEEEIIDNLTFVHLVKMKFRGKETDARSYNNGTEQVYAITIQFPDWEQSSEAYAHCNRNINNEGNIKEDYKGALKYADPALSTAQAMINRAKQVN